MQNVELSGAGPSCVPERNHIFYYIDIFSFTRILTLVLYYIMFIRRNEKAV